MYPFPRISTLRRIVAAVAVVAAPLATPCLAAPAAVANPAVPRDGVRVVTMNELWRLDDTNEEVFLGTVGQIITDEAGDIYVLDRQLSHVVVLDAGGNFLRYLSGEGDGPGEVRRPRDMLMLPDGSLGITQTFPGKIVKLTTDGEPAGEIDLRAEGDGGMFALFNARSRHGTIVVAGDKMGSDPAVVSRTRFLSTIDPDGVERARLLEDELVQDASDFVWDEERDYFVHFGGLALGPDGLIYAAPDRDRYRIVVYRPDGETVREITRDFEPRRRSEEEIRMIHDTRRMIRNGQEVPKRIGEFAPAVSRLWVAADDRLWVLNSRSGRDQPEGILCTYDVFDASGAFVEQLRIQCPGDPEDDLLFPLGDNRAILVRGYVSATVALVGARRDEGNDDQDAAPLELVAYEMGF